MRYFSALCQTDISQIYDKLKSPLLPFACKHRASCTMTNFFLHQSYWGKKKKRIILISMHFSSLKEVLFYRGKVHSKHWYYHFLQGSFTNRQPWSGCLSIITLLLITQSRATFNELTLEKKKKNPTFLANETFFLQKERKGKLPFFFLLSIWKWLSVFSASAALQ